MQKIGSGAPVREPAVDEETYKKMLSFYHKKQEEQKVFILIQKLEEDNEDNFMNAAWADPKNLKRDLVTGGKNISWKPK